MRADCNQFAHASSAIQCTVSHCCTVISRPNLDESACGACEMTYVFVGALFLTLSPSFIALSKLTAHFFDSIHPSGMLLAAWSWIGSE